MSTPVRLACVQYLNALPLVQGLSRWRDGALTPAVPSRIADMVLSGEADLGLASIADFARHADALTLLPVGMIGCDGPTLTVHLYSRTPLADVNVLHADTDSHTSVVLAQLLLAALHGARVRVEPFAAGESRGQQQPDALLLIGDKVISAPPDAAAYPHRLDLGQAWKGWTGLPFVYAAWMCRRGEERSPAVEGACAMLDRQRRRNRGRIGWIADAHAGARQWPVDTARGYLGSLLCYEVTDAARAGAERFFAEAAAAGLLPACAVRWHDGAGAAAP